MNRKTSRGTNPRGLHRKAVEDMVELHPLRATLFIVAAGFAGYGASILLFRNPRYLVAGVGVLSSAIVCSAAAVKVLLGSTD